jgi:hypothetical protein
MSIHEQITGYAWANAFHVAGPPDDSEDTYGCYNDPDLRAVPPGADVSLAPFLRADVKRIAATAEGENDGPDWLCVGRLKDGRWFKLAAGCDYTGWDCQSGGYVNVARTKADLLTYGISPDERGRLGL